MLYQILVIVRAIGLWFIKFKQYSMLFWIPATSINIPQRKLTSENFLKSQDLHNFKKAHKWNSIHFAQTFTFEEDQQL